MRAYDIDTRIADEGRVPLVPLIHVHELTQPGVILCDENMKVTCALVDHPPVTPAFAYRFDTADRSIVTSGDTKRSGNLVKLAQAPTSLCTRRCTVPAVNRLVARVPNAATLKKHIIDSHTSVEDCGRVATAAGAKPWCSPTAYLPTIRRSRSGCGLPQPGSISKVKSSWRVILMEI